MTQGARIRALFENARDEVAVIAPFIKVDALRSLIGVIPAEAQLRCVSRWLPSEIAAGVSDPEIIDLLKTRGNFSLSLVDRLHAKLYIAGDRCLAGSANVTLAGLGERGGGSNIEVLIDTTTDQPAIAATLDAIAQDEREATGSMARTARLLADKLGALPKKASVLGDHWFPKSRRPDRAYLHYVDPPSGFLTAADELLLGDLAGSDLPPGLGEADFRDLIRDLLARIPIAEALLSGGEDATLTRGDAGLWLEEVSGGGFSASDVWVAFVDWMAHFFADLLMKQEIAEIALRRAQVLR